MVWRLKKILEVGGAADVDLIVLTQQPNVVYVSRFPRSSGTVLLISRDGHVTMLVPALDYWRAMSCVELERFEVVPYATYRLPDVELEVVEPPHSHVPKLLKSLGVRRVGVDNPHSKVSAEVERELGVKVIDISEQIAEARAIKHEEELELMRRALRIAEGAISRALSDLKPGVTERVTAASLEYYMRVGGADGLAFETIVAFGPNAAFPHATVTDRVLEERDVVIVDAGAQVGGYSSDVTRTILVGKVDEEVRKVVSAVSEAVSVAVDYVRDGVLAEEVDGRAREVIRRAGYGKFFVHSLGHGVGIEVHEKPRLAQGSKEVLKEGMVVTIEPGVYIPGKFGVRIENMVVVRKQGAEVLNELERVLEV